MTPREKALIGLAALVLLAGIIAYSQVKHTPAPVPATSVSRQASTAPTGNVDNTVNAILGQSTAEANLTADADADAFLVTSDSQEINGLLQAYDENKF